MTVGLPAAAADAASGSVAGIGGASPPPAALVTRARAWAAPPLFLIDLSPARIFAQIAEGVGLHCKSTLHIIASARAQQQAAHTYIIYAPSTVKLALKAQPDGGVP